MRSHAVYGLMSGTSPYWPSIYSVLRPITDIHDVRIAFFWPCGQGFANLVHDTQVSSQSRFQFKIISYIYFSRSRKRWPEKNGLNKLAILDQKLIDLFMFSFKNFRGFVALIVSICLKRLATSPTVYSSYQSCLFKSKVHVL